MLRTHQSSAPQRVEVSSDALLGNLGFLKGLLPERVDLAAVVKANAYGHGAKSVAEVLRGEVDWFAVHSAAEARELRDEGVREPILVMGFVPEQEFERLDQDIHVVVSAPESLGWLGEYRQKSGIALPVHIKVETGTNRQGVAITELDEFCRLAARNRLQVVGIATHFANIEDTLEHEFAQNQLREFKRSLEHIRTLLGEEPVHKHAACSAAALLFRETDFSMIRAGISLYGHWPSRETRLAWVLAHGRGGGELKPVMSWRTMVGQVKIIPRGATVGYGRTWTALRPTSVAVIPIGYADGYPRCLGNKSHVLVRGRRTPVIGRVCMNIIMADVTDVPDVGVGDEVTLVGKQGEEEITVEELAEHAGTIAYELLARLSPCIPRAIV